MNFVCSVSLQQQLAQSKAGMIPKKHFTGQAATPLRAWISPEATDVKGNVGRVGVFS